MAVWLVTGGAGFIGCNFVRRAVARTPHAIVVLDKLTYAGHRLNLADLLDGGRVRLVEGDIADSALVRRLVDELEPSAIVNFAAESHVDRSIDSPRPFVTTNIVGAFELLESARALHARLAPRARAAFRFLHVSTDEVYGSLGPAGRFDERTPYDPRSPYSASKASADHLVRAWGHTYGLPVLVTNCSNNFGPYQFPEKLIPLTVLNAIEGRPLPIYGDGGNVRDWLFVEDHCDALCAVLDRGRPGESYVVGGDNERTNLELVDALCAVLDRVRPRARGSYVELKRFVPDRKGHDRRYAIDASRIKGELGWQPAHRFDEALETTVRWYLAHVDWCVEVQRHARYDRERLGFGEGAS